MNYSLLEQNRILTHLQLVVRDKSQFKVRNDEETLHSNILIEILAGQRGTEEHSLGTTGLDLALEHLRLKAPLQHIVTGLDALQRE